MYAKSVGVCVRQMENYVPHAYNYNTLKHQRFIHKNVRKIKGKPKKGCHDIAQDFRRPNSLKTIPSGVANCRNLPFGGRATRGSRVRVSSEEGARSRHQRLFEGNVGKTKICGLRTLSVKGSGVIFTHGKVLAPHASATKDDNL